MTVVYICRKGWTEYTRSAMGNGGSVVLVCGKKSRGVPLLPPKVNVAWRNKMYWHEKIYLVNRSGVS